MWERRRFDGFNENIPGERGLGCAGSGCEKILWFRWGYMICFAIFPCGRIISYFHAQKEMRKIYIHSKNVCTAQCT